MMEKSPSLSSSQDASPVLASIADMMKDQESGNMDVGQTALVASLTKVMWRRSPGKKDEFWESLQSHYNYLMDKELIETCKEANGELTWDDADLTSGCTWTFAEFMLHYKQLLEWLDIVQKNMNVADDQGHYDETIRKCFVNDVEEHLLLHKVFNEQAQRIIRRHPNMEGEINSHITHVNHRWGRLEKIIASQQDSKDVLKDIALEIRCLRKWLREMENQVHPVAVYPGWTLDDLEMKFKEHQLLQKEIESRGKNVLRVIRLCDHVHPEREGASSDGGLRHVHRIALNLERRWHALWLRSLEWQCLLEELIKFNTDLSLEDQAESSFSDEPLTKFPRLSGEWTGKTLWLRKNENIPFEENNQPAHSPAPDSDLEDLLNLDEMELDALNEPVEMPSNDEMKTRDIGTLYEAAVTPCTNEKGIMVGTTGIAELKADCHGDYKNFEIIQDVGYSSESSIQLSNDDHGGDPMHICNYNDTKGSSEDLRDEDLNEKRMDENSNPNNLRRCQNLNSNYVKAHDEGDLSVDDGSLPDDNGVVSRTGPNCATFYFRHVDTDNEYKTEDIASDMDNETDKTFVLNQKTSGTVHDEMTENIHSPSLIRRRQWSDTMLSVKPSSARMDVEFLTDVESPQSSLSEEEMRGTKCLTDAEKLLHLGKNYNTERNNKAKSEYSETEKDGQLNHLNTGKREFIQELVEQAERLVQEDKKDNLHTPQSVWLGEARAKKSRLKEWLTSHESLSRNRPAALPPETVIDSSCDASGEYTSNDSEDEYSISSSEEQDNSVIMCNDGNLSMGKFGDTKQLVSEQVKPLSSSEPSKVVMRNKKRNSRDRPWSVTELYQLTNRLDLTPFSISESALNKLLLTPGEQDSRVFRDGLDATSNSTTSTSVINTSCSSRKTKSTKSRKRYARRSDSGSEGLSQSRSSILPSGGSDGGTQKSPSRRRQSLYSKSHSSGSESGRKQYSLCESGGRRNLSHSSGTEQYFSETVLGDTLRRAEETDSESEPTQVFQTIPKNHPSEELSSLSEQAWDDYQDSPYLSEPYSEKLIDEEQMRKLMEFGDDYRMYIESHSDTASQSSYSGIYNFPNKRFRNLANKNQIGKCEKLEPTDIDSDSDLEDLHHILRDSSNQLQYSQHLLQKQTSMREPANPVDYIEFLATCHTNIKCLQTLDGNLQSNRDWSLGVESSIKEVLTGWEMLKHEAQDHQQEMQHLKKVQKEMTELRESMNNIDNSLISCGKQIENKDFLDHMIREIQAYLLALQEKKKTLLTINLQVHSFFSGGHQDASTLKAEVAALYYLWDQVFERSNDQLTALRGLKTTWTKYDTDYEKLSDVLEKDQQRLSTTQLSATPSLSAEKQVASLTSGVEVSPPPVNPVVRTDVAMEEQHLMMARDAELAALESQAKQLEAMLAETSAWDTISQQLTTASSKLCQLKEKSQELNATVIEQLAFASPKAESARENLQTLPETNPDIFQRRKSVTDGDNGRHKHSMLRRAMRYAVPFQVMIVVLFCAACLMEPHCCDSINNFSLSFSPQLHYVRGPPPI